ncbi:MAG: tRNA1Val (adenine37-N6)-methyltransferase [Crocinitomix sp.]|jgi:tRNA1Val (adenine37-N6)-methyltransferase
MSRPFKFKHFTIQQELNAQKVGSDSMLLGASIEGEFKRILDIGTGTGILALMLAQKNVESMITAIESDLTSLNEALINFNSSKFSHQFLAVHARLQEFGAMEKFDLIVCNPPYFENAFLSSNEDRNRARHNNDLPVHELYEYAAELLNEQGEMAIVIPTDEEYNHLKRAAHEGLFPYKILRTVKEAGGFKRSLITYSFNDDIEPTLSQLLVKSTQNEYSDAYIELTKDFYFKDLKKIQSEVKDD